MRPVPLLLPLSFGLLFTVGVRAQDQGDAEVRSADSRILLRFATFDPLAALPPVPEQLLAAADTHLWIVQWQASPTDEDRAAVRAAGGVIRGYLPHDAHVVRFEGSGGVAFARLPRVRWVGAYEPAYRLEQPLLAELLAGAELPVRRYNMVMADKRADKAALAAKIVAIGGRVTDHHLGGLLFTAELSGAQLVAAARLDEVLWIDRWTESGTDMDNARTAQGSNTIEAIAGYTGSGVRGHVYEGVEAAHTDFNTIFTNVRSGGGADTHGHCTAGCIFGNGTSAPQARGHAPDAVGFFTQYSTVTAGWSRNMVIGDVVNVHNCMFTTASWGGAQTPSYTSVSADSDDIVFDHRIPWTNSMSNLGNTNVRPEAWAKNVISVGALVHGNNAVAGDDIWAPWAAGGLPTAASIGPAADGRRKPDLCNFYDNVWTSDRTGAAGYSAGNSNTGFGGTSAATPITAGLNALAIQMYTDHILNNTPRVSGGTRFQNRPYAQTLKALQIACASAYPVAQATRNQAGWGYANVATMYDRRSRLTVIPENVPITQGATQTYSILVAPGETQLKVCMTYLDPAGIVAAAIDRVNDLTLRVVSPGGTSYWGNNGLVANNTSTSGGAANTLDTVECVFLNSPAAGIWTVEITAPILTTDAHLATAATDATYALVVNGGTRLLGSGCARYSPDSSVTGVSNLFPWGGYAPSALPSLFASNNSGAVGGAVYFDVAVASPMYITALELNTALAAGGELLCDIYRTTAGVSHAGNETNPALWLPMSAGKGTSAGLNVASPIALATPFFLPAGTYGFAVVASNFEHRYTNGTGANQNYNNADIALAMGSASNVPFTAAFTPRVANVRLGYRLDSALGTNMRYQTILRQGELGVAGAITGLAFTAADTGRHWNSSLLVRMSHVPAGHTMSSTFGTNLPAPVTVLNQSNHSFDYAEAAWREIGLQTPFAYNGTSDVVVDIVARGNWQTVASGFYRAGSEPRVFDAQWTGATPVTGTVDNLAARLRVSFNCASANEFGASCGRLEAAHAGDGRRNSTFYYRVNNATPNFVAFVSFGTDNSGPGFPLALNFLGWTNCHAWHTADNILGVPTNPAGVGEFALNLPNSAALDGAKLYGTWIGFDTSEPGNLTFSGYTRMIVGLAP
jgi:serine protease AprX